MRVYHLTPYQNLASIKKAGGLVPRGDSPVQFGLKSHRPMVEFPGFAARNRFGYVELAFDIPARELSDMPRLADKVSNKLVPLKYLKKAEFVSDYTPKVIAAYRIDNGYAMVVKHPARNYYPLIELDDGNYKVAPSPVSKKIAMKMIFDAVAYATGNEWGKGLDQIEAKWPYEIPKTRKIEL